MSSNSLKFLVIRRVLGVSCKVNKATCLLELFLYLLSPDIVRFGNIVGYALVTLLYIVASFVINGMNECMELWPFDNR